MAPTFRTTFLNTTVRRTLTEAYTGWALDFIWPLMLKFPLNKIGIVDLVCMGHSTQPQEGRQRVYNAKMPRTAYVEYRISFLPLFCRILILSLSSIFRLTPATKMNMQVWGEGFSFGKIWLHSGSSRCVQHELDFLATKRVFGFASRSSECLFHFNIYYLMKLSFSKRDFHSIIYFLFFWRSRRLRQW